MESLIALALGIAVGACVYVIGRHDGYDAHHDELTSKLEGHCWLYVDGKFYEVSVSDADLDEMSDGE